MIEQPLTLPCGHTIKNRFIKAAMTEGLATPADNATLAHQVLYKTWAKGGAAVLVSGNIMVDKRYLERAGNVVVEDEQALAQLSAWANETHAGGSELWAQISHPGRQCPRLVSTQPISASDVQLNMIANFGKPRAASLDDINDIVQRFATTAKILKKAGFDGVQIHSAHGYLLSQFLSPITNKRDDEYGGSLENRARLLLRVIKTVRDAVGPDFPIAVKLNSSDFQKGGFSADECIQVVQWLNDANIDLLEVSGGTYEQLEFFQQSDQKVRASTQKREAYFLEYAENIKKVAKMPVMVTGGFRSLAGMESALNKGQTDVIGLARPFCLNPNFPNDMMKQSLELLEEVESKLILGNGFWGPTSSSKSIQALNNQCQAGWYYHQIEQLAQGKPSNTEYSPRKALFSHFRKDFIRAIKRKFAS
ncbi:MAG: 2,4-dienoyl-CoA reductase-like NADH-dependent reductase (Old Yellow Enzyme family) [Bermanella sp.]|jgi:2,4-dienoyl-CoA reductase-like NADH-dependent reductase (Old Yellow Enzyme family)